MCLLCILWLLPPKSRLDDNADSSDGSGNRPEEVTSQVEKLSLEWTGERIQGRPQRCGSSDFVRIGYCSISTEGIADKRNPKFVVSCADPRSIARTFPCVT